MTTNRPLVLITGASFGIGSDLSRVFALNGYDLIVVARTQERLNQLAQSLSLEFDCQVYVESCDLSVDMERTKLLNRLGKQNLLPDVVVNNAGVGSNGPFWTLPREREMAQVKLNIAALVEMTHHFLPNMVSKGTGGILNIASTAGFQAGPYMAVYFATKSFVLSFSEALGHELRDTGVHVTAYCPGPTESMFGQTAGNDTSLLFKTSVASSESVAKDAYRAFSSKKKIAVHGWLNRLVVWCSELSPRWIRRRVTARLNRP